MSKLDEAIELAIDAGCEQSERDPHSTPDIIRIAIIAYRKARLAQGFEEILTNPPKALKKG